MLKEIKPKHFLIVSDVDETLCASLSLMQYQADSNERLFTSYMNNTSEQADKFNLQKFLELQADLYAKIEMIKLEVLKSVAKNEYWYLMHNPFKYNIDNINRTVKFIRQ